MTAALLSPDQTAALQELANIGMGHAGNAISRAWREFVTLSVPQVTTVPAARLSGLIAQLVGKVPVSATRQSIRGALHGEALVVLTGPNRLHLGELVHVDCADAGVDPAALLADSADLLTSACLGSMARELHAALEVGPAALIGEEVPAQEVVPRMLGGMDSALCIELRLKVERRSITAHLVLLMGASEVARLAALLDSFLCSL